MSTERHRLARARFAETAAEFSSSQAVRTLAHIETLLRLADPSPEDCLLDVACGPGRLLAAFAPRVRFVVGLDLTPEMLGIARRQRLDPPARPLGLVLGLAERLPFSDGAFTLVATTLAIHHYGDPAQVLREMVRVCRPGGQILIADLVGSSDDAKRARANEIERLRDPSHVELLSAGGLEQLATGRGLEVAGRVLESVSRDVGEWCRVAGTPPEVIPRVRALLLASQPGDLAGMAPVLIGEELRFRHDVLSLVCRRR